MAHLEAARGVVRERIGRLRPLLERRPGLYKLFENCFMNTLDTTVQETGCDTFVITGDITAMWLRDSTAQVLHYIRFCDDPDVAALIEGLIARQAKNILLDPYANAFNREPSDYKPFDDHPRAGDWVWERKYEIDSLCHPVLLAHRYHAQTGSTAFMTEDFMKALATIVDVFATEQDHAQSPYRFERTNCPPSDTLPNGGMGAPVARTGMTWSGFRPSDDACMYGYLIPANLFAAQELIHIARFARLKGDEALAARAEALADEIRRGVERHGVVHDDRSGEIYAYEVDGLGHVNLMDDANVPSLLALPYLGLCDKDDPRYLNTRAFVLSDQNPFYYEGKLARGIGSPHTPKGMLWPIALAVQAMTSTNEAEIASLVDMLASTHAGTYFMHESLDPDDPARFTRPWFAWANSMFGELIYRLYEEGRLEAVIGQ
ncbi:MAG: glycoside hydrolase family 125 protein [Clostridiales bacterium]|nr:glycoside hydrolase family 125 protein [Clostridiales bacterium]